MGYETLLLLVAFVLTLPFALWMRRRARIAGTSASNNRIVLVFVLLLCFVLGVSAINGYFYPYGWPESEVPGLRAAAEACGERYAYARTRAESTGIDTLILPRDDKTAVLTCQTLRRNRLPGCREGSRCERIKSSLGLPR